MLDLFPDNPGRYFLAATLLPLVSVALILAVAVVRNLTRSHTTTTKWAASIYWLLGGEQPLKTGGYLTFAAFAASATLAILGLIHFHEDLETFRGSPAPFEARWAERIDWIRIGASKADPPASVLQLGYRIDRLSALMVTMVTVVSSLIALFSLGYMKDEGQERVEDHAAHFERRGRFGRFFLFLGLFVFSMLNLLIADNLLQVFIGWELVGVCSFFLIGFYYERRSAAVAANKAFIINRIGDAGFLIGIAILWATFGTLNIEELIAKFDTGRPAALTDSLWIVMGLGLFLGCVGKSAQFPLHTWLPDAMEGPTPVSALIHAATMVAAGVYLVGRVYPLFSPDVLVVIAYTGAITLFIAATIATVTTDIKRVLAYSTVSQLGYMMLALGVGGWTAGLFHLLTHAFFKALLFLGSGSVIHGLHHEQDLRKMGGLRQKMPVTAYTMLVGVLAISGTPFFSGWYSKDAILADTLGYGVVHREHSLLYVVPFITAGMTAFYMFRLWFLAFAGKPRDRHAFDHAHESPWTMTVPLVVLAAFSFGIGWGWPAWDANASVLAHELHEAEPHALHRFSSEHSASHVAHSYAGWLGLFLAACGAGTAAVIYAVRNPSVALDAKSGWVVKFLANKWYFDELYAALVFRPTMLVGASAAAADKRPTPAEEPATSPIDPGTLDGLLNTVGQSLAKLGNALRTAQTGFIRSYVLVLILTVVGALGMLAVLTR